MPDREDAAPPPLAARVRAASLRVLPVLLVAGGIALWFGSIGRACEPQFAAWAAAFEESIRSGSPRLPHPGRLADDLLRAPVEAALAVPVDPASAVRVEASPESGEAVASWIDRDGGRRYLELRCDGGSVEVRGVGVESASMPKWDEEAR